MIDQAIRVRTGSRLHLGLLSVPGIDTVGRTFGGAGLMLDDPDVVVRAEPSDDWRVDGPSADRVLDWARRLEPASPRSILIEHCPEPHVGLGTGTQLALAVAAAICPDLDAIDLAKRTGRGLRSGLGVHGFAHGGFLVDGGKGPTTAIAPLVCRHPFPDDWRILLATPRRMTGLAGADERAAFAKLAHGPVDRGQTEALCRIVLLEMIPALLEQDLRAFGESVYDFNRRSGLLFKSSQGGEYATPVGAELVAWLRSFGLNGVGQSSWGPTIFAIADADRARNAANRLVAQFSDLDIRIVAARNNGADRSTTQ